MSLFEPWGESKKQPRWLRDVSAAKGAAGDCFCTEIHANICVRKGALLRAQAARLLRPCKKEEDERDLGCNAVIVTQGCAKTVEFRWR